MCTINVIIYINAVILCNNFGKMNHPSVYANGATILHDAVRFNRHPHNIRLVLEKGESVSAVAFNSNLRIFQIFLHFHLPSATYLVAVPLFAPK